MKSDFKINKKSIIVLLCSALLIVIFNNLKIDWYIKSVILPFSVMLVSYIYLFEEEKELNQKAYYLLVPIVLILMSDLILKIDESNKFLNVIVLPILLTTFFMTLTNKNFFISSKIIAWVFKLFPNKLFSNLKYLKSDGSKTKSNRAVNIFMGVIIGCVIGSVILLLLASADDYFGYFIHNIKSLFKLDFGNIIQFIIYFIVLFSIFTNISLNKNTKVSNTKYDKLDDIMVTIILSIINVIFVLFLVSEVSRLTTNFLQLPVRYTYSSYAREGFFQLLFVTLINFIVIMYLLYKTKIVGESSKVKNLILSLIGFSIILIFNSYYRMFLYINHYGFTILRLQVILFLAMELIIFGVLIKKILKGLKFKDALIYFIIMTGFYIINLYTCNTSFIKLIS